MTTTMSAQEPGEKELLGDNYDIVQLENDFREMYGPDQKLINGKQYHNLHVRSTGHKFFGEDEYQKGKLLIDNSLYNDVQLKYDIYNQQVLLLFKQFDIAQKEIIVNDLKLREFQLGDMIFKKCYFPETDTLLFQVFKGEQLTFLYHWHKNSIPVAEGAHSLSEFGDPLRKSYVLTPDGLHRFRNARSFVAAFPQYRSALMKFLRKNKIRLTKASNQQIWELHGYCNQLMTHSLNKP